MAGERRRKGGREGRAGERGREGGREGGHIAQTYYRGRLSFLFLPLVLRSPAAGDGNERKRGAR